MHRPRFGLLAVILALLLPASSALAQFQPTTPGPDNSNLGAVLTNTARAPATVNSKQLDNASWNGAECTFNQSSASGSPSTVFSIQFYDAASATYQSLVTSGAITQSSTPTTVVVYPGVQTSALPTGMVALSMKLPRKWRVTQTVTGSNTTTTGTIGCNLLR